MIAKLIEFSVKNKFLMLLLTGVLVLGGAYAIYTIPLDAIPDLSDVQVIVFTEFPGQAPQVVEDQVTYPLTTTMLAVPNAKTVRGYSFFGFSFVYIIFEDGTDIYWARSRVLEYLSFVANRLPPGVTPRLGPDATGVGWVYEYSLYSGWYSPDHPAGLFQDPEQPEQWYASVQDAPATVRDRLLRVRVFDQPGKCPLSGKPLVRANQDLSTLRSLQDWYLRYELTAVEGVSEVASVGGYVKQYQVEVDPDRLLAFHLSIQDVRRAIQRSNNDVGGRVIEISENEYMVRGLGYLGGGTSDPETSQRAIDDLAHVSLGTTAEGTPIFLREVAQIHLGPELRRGLAESDGKGEVAGGVVIMRFGENAYEIIENVKEKLDELKVGLPPGVDIKTEYDRSALIERAVDTLKQKLLEEMIVVALVITIFLLHFRSSLVAIFVLPTGVMAAMLLMHGIGLTANIMSLGGIALAIGVMVDSAIIMIENTHKHLEAPGDRSHAQIIIDACSEVGPQLFFSLLVITVSFVPIFSLTGQSGRLFRPLAFTNMFAIGSAAVLAVVMVPVLMEFFVRGRVPSEERNPLSKLLMRIYEPLFWLGMRGRAFTILVAIALVAVTVWPFSQLGSEFMPPLEEGDLLYMPTTDPSISITKARELLQQTDKLIMTFPEVHHVFGKAGRADTPTDPAGLSMLETTIALEHDKSKWRTRRVERWFGGFPNWVKAPLAYFWPEERTITDDELVYGWNKPDGTHVPGLDDVVKLPGVSNAWTMPIKTRIDMLSTGIKTPIGIKVIGDDLGTLADLAEKISAQLRTLPDTVSVFAEKTVGGKYIDFKIKREEVARYGMTVDDVQQVILAALGGTNVTTTVEGLERYPVNVRYPRELRDNLTTLRQTLIATPTGAQIPIEQVAELSVHTGPPVIRSEQAKLNAWIYVDVATSDIGGYVRDARALIDDKIVSQPDFPTGYSVTWSGQYEYMQEANQRLMVVVPITLVIIIFLLYVSTRSVFRTLVIIMAVPFSLVGAIWFLYLLDFQLSLAVWVGLIALAGLDAETGAVMLLYLDISFKKFVDQDRMRNLRDLELAIHDGAVKRIRPKTMTVMAALFGLVPIMIGAETGADTMKRLAAPMIGGLVTSFIMELLIYPVIFYFYKSFEVRRRMREEPGADETRANV
ncbi:Cation efflux system protein CusA [Bremerella volcania]|uniref:Cation efflux system protein CusA n=1 Tax=Bremerella volcania TaxID=2527984 RepID=A0A518C5Q2_9BACT|nr:CusA/CzcA family heavy metal efflux RND transporter [Bremerella volcania]QDU74549.1 Cation efflux system protein CusA [Bremerella volcania]